ncbi:SCAN domain-containing protein 3 [Trichonephila clavipes]|nr:SCAN domain-containing protein 3 [Trichonephila clavipes]
MFGDNFAKELQSIPLSNDTVSRRIDDIAEDVEQQLFGKLRDKLFSIQLDEATDSNKDAHFIALGDYNEHVMKFNHKFTFYHSLCTEFGELIMYRRRVRYVQCRKLKQEKKL